MFPSFVLQVWGIAHRSTPKRASPCGCVYVFFSGSVLCEKSISIQHHQPRNIINIHRARPAEPGVLFANSSLGPLRTVCIRWHSSTLGLLIMSEFWLCFNCCIAEQPQPVSHSCFVSRGTFIPQETGSAHWLLSSTCADQAQSFYSHKNKLRVSADTVVYCWRKYGQVSGWPSVCVFFKYINVVLFLAEVLALSLML